MPKALPPLNQLPQVSETWEAAFFRLRTWVKERSRLSRPWQMIVVTPQGLVRQSEMFNAAPTFDQAWELLAKAMSKPLAGSHGAQRPQAVAFSQPELAEALGPRLAEIDVSAELRAGLPALQEAAEALQRHLNRNQPAVANLLDVPGVSYPLLERLYGAAARLYRLAPWRRFPLGETPIEVRAPASAPPRCVVVMGAAGEEFGFSVYDRIEDLATMLDMADPTKLPKRFSWLVLHYETPDYLGFGDLEAAEAQGWNLAGPRAYPAFSRVSPRKFAAPPRQDLLWLEAALPALEQLFHGELEFDRFGEVKPLERTFTVDLLDGPAEVAVRLPAWLSDREPETASQPEKANLPKKTVAALEELHRKFEAGELQAAARQGLELLPGLPAGSRERLSALYVIGISLGRLGFYPYSYQAFQLAQEIAPQDAEVYHNMGIAAILGDRSAQAVRCLEQAVALAQDKDTRRECKDTLDRARRQLKADLKRAGRGFTEPQLYDLQEASCRGDLAIQAQRWAEAEQELRAAIAVADFQPGIQCDLGVCLVVQGRPDEAETAFRRALELDPQHEQAQKNLQTLLQQRQVGEEHLARAKGPAGLDEFDLSALFAG